MAHERAPTPSAPSRFEALDAWRGILALLVAFLHAPFADPFRDAAWLDNLQFCVDVFFVLSGFVLMHGFGTRLASGAAVRRFATVRLGRLWPLHAVVLAAFVLIEVLRFAAVRHGGDVALTLQPFGPGRGLAEILDNLLLLQGIGPAGSLSWNFPAWSIAVEFWTSLVFAGLVWRFGPRNLLPFAAVALASGLALHALSPATPLVIERWGLLRCLCDFSAGCLACQIRARVARHLAAGTALELAAVGVAVAFVVGVRAGPVGYLAPPLCGAFVLVFSLEGGAVSRLLHGAVPQALGRWSFSIYMLHVLVFEIVRASAHLAEAGLHRTLLVAHGDGQSITTASPLLDLALALGSLAFVVVPLAASSYRFVERPALAAVKAWAASRMGRSYAPRLTPSGSLP